MRFDATYQGKVMRLHNGVVYQQRADGRFAAAYAAVDRITQVTLTGYTAVSPLGNTHYQTTSGGWIYLPDGWEEIGTVAVARYSDSAAQALVDKIMRNNTKIVRCNLLCARYASRFSEQEQVAIRDLQNRVIARNEALQADGLTDKRKTGYPAEYAELSGYLDALMKGEAIGIAVSTWIVIVVACAIVVGAGTAAYFAYKSLADESERDVKYSEELTRSLVEKLTPEEYQQLLDETKGMLTKTKIKSLVSGGFGAIKWIAAAAGAYVIYKVIKQNL